MTWRVCMTCSRSNKSTLITGFAASRQRTLCNGKNFSAVLRELEFVRRDAVSWLKFTGGPGRSYKCQYEPR
jgi:hypothetical protein